MALLDMLHFVLRLTKRRLRRTCTLDQIGKDASFLYPPPNGGWGWVVAMAAAIHCLLVSGFHSAFGVYMMPLIDNFKASNSRIAWIGSISYGFIMIFGPISGKLLVKYGAIKVAIIGALVLMFGLVCSSYTHDLRVLFFTHGILVGVGSSLAYTPGLIMVSLYFTTRRSFATGMVMAGGAAGTVVQNKLHQYLISEFGWRASMRVYSGILSICIFAGFAYKPLQKHRAHPSVVEKFKTSPLRGFIVDLGLWKDRIFEVWVTALGLAKFGFSIPFVHMVKLADDLEIPLDKASYIMVGLGLSSMISCLLFGKICDIENIDRLYLNQASILSVGVVYFLIPHCRTFGSLLAICSLLGFFDAGNYVLLPVLTFDLMGAEKMPTAWGFMMAVNAISCFGPPFAGAIYDAYGSYTTGFIVTGICNIAAASILALIPWLQRAAVQSTKNYINASVCIITNTIVPWQSPSLSQGSITSSSIRSPEQSMSDHSKGFSVKSIKSILKADTTSYKSGMLSPQRTTDRRYSLELPDSAESSIELKPSQDLDKSEWAGQVSESVSQAEPISHKKESTIMDDSEGDDEEQAKIAFELKRAQELTVSDALLLAKERSDSKQMEHIPHRKEDGVAFLDEYEGDEEEHGGSASELKHVLKDTCLKIETSDSKQIEQRKDSKQLEHRKEDGVAFLDDYVVYGSEQMETAADLKPIKDLTVPDETVVERERSDSKQVERLPHRKEDGVAFLDDYLGEEEDEYVVHGSEKMETVVDLKPMKELTVPDEIVVEREKSDSKQVERIPHRKEDGVAFLDDYLGEEEERLWVMPSTAHRKEDGVVFIEDIDDYDTDQQPFAVQSMKDAAPSETTSKEKDISKSVTESGHTSHRKDGESEEEDSNSPLQ